MLLMRPDITAGPMARRRNSENVAADIGSLSAAAASCPAGSCARRPRDRVSRAAANSAFFMRDRLLQDEHLDLAELDGMALGLQGDVTLGERRAVLLDRRIEVVDHAAPDGRPFVLEHQ